MVSKRGVRTSYLSFSANFLNDFNSLAQSFFLFPTFFLFLFSFLKNAQVGNDLLDSSFGQE
jgi:hypothetical protein